MIDSTKMAYVLRAAGFPIPPVRIHQFWAIGDSPFLITGLNGGDAHVSPGQPWCDVCTQWISRHCAFMPQVHDILPLIPGWSLTANFAGFICSRGREAIHSIYAAEVCALVFLHTKGINDVEKFAEYVDSKTWLGEPLVESFLVDRQKNPYPIKTPEWWFYEYLPGDVYKLAISRVDNGYVHYRPFFDCLSAALRHSFDWSREENDMWNVVCQEAANGKFNIPQKRYL
jgi:hypothetical protein